MDKRFENEVRIFVTRHFVSQCRAPTVAEVADALAVTAVTVRDAFVSLAEQHVLALLPETGELWMAMPSRLCRPPFA